jgi:hypothetical protein
MINYATTLTKALHEHPTGRWVTQQVRNLMMDLPAPFGFLLRGRDAKYPTSFDAVFHAEGITTVKTPIQAPRATRFVNAGLALCARMHRPTAHLP